MNHEEKMTEPKNSKWKILLDLYWTFFKSASITFGGGLANFLSWSVNFPKKPLEQQTKSCSTITQSASQLPVSLR